MDVIKLLVDSPFDTVDHIVVYRSLLEFTEDTLPAPYKTVQGNVNEFIDTDVVSGTSYFYLIMVSDGYKKSHSKVIPATAGGGGRIYEYVSTGSSSIHIQKVDAVSGKLLGTQKDLGVAWTYMASDFDGRIVIKKGNTILLVLDQNLDTLFEHTFASTISSVCLTNTGDILVSDGTYVIHKISKTYDVSVFCNVGAVSSTLIGVTLYGDVFINVKPSGNRVDVYSPEGLLKNRISVAGKEYGYVSGRIYRDRVILSYDSSYFSNMTIVKLGLDGELMNSGTTPKPKRGIDCHYIGDDVYIVATRASNIEYYKEVHSGFAIVGSGSGRHNTKKLQPISTELTLTYAPDGSTIWLEQHNDPESPPESISLTKPMRGFLYPKVKESLEIYPNVDFL